MGDDSNPALRKFPYEELAAKGGALKYKTRTRQYLVLVYQVPGMYVFFSARCFGEMGVAGERTSRTSPQTFEQSYEKLCGDGHLSWALCP